MMAFERDLDGEDPTAIALRDVLTTLDGEQQAAEHDVVTALPGLDGEQPTPKYDGNWQLENELMEVGVFKTRGVLQRRVLGCLACQQDGRSGDWRGIRPTAIAECAGASESGVRRVLGQLRGHDLVEAQRFSNYGARGQRPEWLTLSPEWAGRERQPQAPPQCGPGGRQEEPNTQAEQLLLDEGALGWRGHLPKAILGCIACRLRAGEPGAYGKGISDCQGTLPGSTNAALRSLYESGILTAEEQRGPANKGGRARIVYRPSQTPAGQALAELLEVPSACGLEPNNQEKGPAAA